MAMTLFEVGISLLIVAMTITIALLLFPVGLKSQQESRYRLIAAAQAQALVQSHLDRQQHITFGTEGTDVWDRPYTNPTVNAPDLDGGINMARWSSFVPLPPAILERIDSDQDELARIAADGNPVFWTQSEGGDSKLIFAFSGHTQQNALTYHPQIKWPYHDWYPTAAIGNWVGVMDTEVGILWRMGAVLQGLGLIAQGDFFNHAWSNDKARLRLALQLCGIDFDVEVLPAPSQSDLEAEYSADTLRFNARTDLLRFYAWACGRDAAAYTAGSVDPANWANAATYPDPNPPVGDFQIAHAWMLAYIGYLQYSQPYDLCSSRNYTMSTMLDSILLQYDLTAALRDPSGATAPVALMHAWNTLSSRPINGVHANTHWNGIDPGLRSGTTGWNLTKPFAPSERCRDLVVWAVDWQSYEDFESVPGTPMDSAMLPRLPKVNIGNVWAGGSPGVASSFYAQENMHPEFSNAWFDASRTSTVNAQNLANGGAFYQNHGQGASNNSIASYLVRHGADRNANGVYDRGTTRNSVRLRASLITRFLAYDPRLHLQLR
ncbi:MAG: hypothetical protein H0W72_02800 [Planctomycetes bacterium]|nr:hypothetical protein [Planctomycetota bacterium]